MHILTVATTACALLATAVCGSPSPKVNSVHYPNNPKFSAHHRRGVQKRALVTDSVKATTTTPSTKAPRSNIWNSLTNDEAAAVIAYIHKQPSLDVTAVANATSWDKVGESL
jgi:primary-amine oxidase